MCACACVCVHPARCVCTNTHMNVCVATRSQHCLPIVSSTLFLRQALSLREKWKPAILIDWLSNEQQEFSCFCCPGWEFLLSIPIPTFLCRWCWGLNSGSHIHKSSIWITRPSSQHLIKNLKLCLALYSEVLA